MSPERTQKLISALKAWCKTHNVKQIDLARMLGVSPQGVTEWFKGRKQPTGEQVLAMQEILNRKQGSSKKRGEK